MPTMLRLLLLSFGISLDAFSTSITDGLLFDKINVKRALAIAVVLGIFLGAMPFAGFFIGKFLINKFTNNPATHIAHIAGHVLLCGLGVKFIIQGIAEYLNKRTAKKIETVAPGTLKEKINEKLTPRILIVQGIAVSIDTLVVGLALSTIEANIFSFAIFTSVITAVACFFGAFIGKKYGDFLVEKADFLGGIILIAIGIKFF